MTFLANLCKCSGMSLNRLANPRSLLYNCIAPLTLNAEGFVVLPGNSDEHEPFLIWGDSIVDDLGTRQRGMAVEDFLGRGCLVCDGPVVDGCVGNHSNGCFGDPWRARRQAEEALSVLLSPSTCLLPSF